MKVNRRHKNRFLSGWKTTVTAVLAFLCLLPDPALSQKKDSNYKTAGIESISSNNTVRSSIGQPLIGRMSVGSIRGFAGVLYRISQPPRIESVPPIAVLEDSLYRYQVGASDANGDSILYSIVEGPAGMQVTASGEILWTPTQNEVGSNDVMLAVYDMRGDSSFQSWSIEVTNLNDPPEIALPDTLASLPEDSSVVISFIPFVSDVDNGLDDLILSAEIIDSQGSEMMNGQQSGPGFMGKKDIEAEFGESRFNRFKVSSFDEPGFRSMGLSASTSSLIISIDDSAKSVTLSGMPDSSGVFRVVFSVSDPDSSTASDTTIVLVTPRNDAPVVSNVPDISFLEDSTFTIDLDAYVFDVDNDTSELSWTAELADGDSGMASVIKNGDLGRNLKRTDLVTISGNRKR
ncbi:MAG: hypothetical protein IH825_01610, partial [Candidatus Marinimicrobia bacterium]|nr:hypothetical protein [Candidatus Neomarinimicrobiota bacterium]